MTPVHNFIPRDLLASEPLILVVSDILSTKDLARTNPACHLDRQFHENLLFWTGKNFYEEFLIVAFVGNSYCSDLAEFFLSIYHPK